MNIKNKTILITGGGSGIGLAIAKNLSEYGAKVIICGRNKEKLERVVEANPNLNAEVCDVVNDEQIKSLLNTFGEKYGGIDLLINNAGIFEHINYAEASVSMEKQEKEIAIDFTGPIRMVHHFLPMLKEREEAAIVNVSSGLAFVPLTLAPVYSATKAGLHSWTRSLRYQLAKSNIKVFELMPPLVETDMVADFEGQKMMDPNDLADSLRKGIANDKFQITPGQSSQLRMMSRLAPNFIFKMLNKQF